MQDRSSRPKLIPTQTAEALAERIITLRRQRLCGRHIAQQTGVSPATVSRVLRRAGLSRLRDLAPAEPVVRYEYKEPGGLIHLDIKKLGRFERVGHRITGDRTGQSNGRGMGWEYVHICIDDASRIAVTRNYPDEKAVSAIAALRAAVAYYQSLGWHRHHGDPCDDGQWVLLQGQDLPRRLQGPETETHPHQALHAQNQRQGREIHPDRSARMGLCPRLHHGRAAKDAPTGTDAYAQLASPARQPKLKATNQSVNPGEILAMESVR